MGYADYAKMFDGVYDFKSSKTFDKDLVKDTKNVIELITIPNNPSSEQRTGFYTKTSVHQIHDMAYYWPSLTTIEKKADFDLMVFTCSKSLGVAGTRIGYGLIKDKEIATLMSQYVDVTTNHASNDAQYRAMAMMRWVSDHSKPYDNFFGWIKEKMADRWVKLDAWLAKRTKQFKSKSAAGFYYMWVECLQETDGTCAD